MSAVIVNLTPAQFDRLTRIRAGEDTGSTGLTVAAYRNFMSNMVMEGRVSRPDAIRLIGTSACPEFCVIVDENIERTVERERPDWASKTTNSDLQGPATDLKQGQQ